MTTLINELQKQSPGSAFIQLFELELSSTSSIYFHSGNDASYANIQFRDRLVPTTIRTYEALPVEFDGFSASSDGPSNRPTITFANVLDTFLSSLGNFTLDDLIGKKVYRRRTLQKYLYGEVGDSNPPIEYGIQSYIIDRKIAHNSIAIIFDLASPFDVDNVTLPRRVVIPNACNWEYQGAGKDKSEHLKRGACTWRTNSKIFSDGTEIRVTLDKNERILAPSTEGTFTPWTATTFIINSLVSVDESITRFNLDGTSTSVTLTKKFRANTGGTLSSPTLTDSSWTAVLPYTSWSISATYYTYSAREYNSLVLYNDNIWKAKIPNTAVTPGFNDTWERVDTCAKKLNSCAARYGFDPIVQSSTKLSIPKFTTLNKELPYGGFPSSRSLQG
jgi:lambda family phage minor tail protein L